jgi:hypothetical protein
MVAAAALLPRVARGEPTDEARLLAHELFVQGRALAARGEHAAACPKFAESQRLAPAGGTLLNLAVCHEAIGRIATAWFEFGEALRFARRDGRPERVEFAEAHLAKLGPRLPRLRIVVHVPNARGLEITCDGVKVGEAGWGESMPLDAGDHVVEALAPEHERRRILVRVEEGEETTARIEPLAPIPQRTPPAPRALDLRMLGTLIGGVGLATGAVGGVLGFRAISDEHNAARLCPTARACSNEGEALNDRAKTAADASTALLVTGGALVIGGAVLFVLSPKRAGPARARIVPTGGGVALEGAF